MIETSVDVSSEEKKTEGRHDRATFCGAGIRLIQYGSQGSDWDRLRDFMLIYARVVKNEN